MEARCQELRSIIHDLLERKRANESADQLGDAYYTRAPQAISGLRAENREALERAESMREANVSYLKEIDAMYQNLQNLRCAAA